MAELTYFSVISRVDGSSGKRRITIHPKIEGGRRSTDVHQVNEGGPPDTGDGANLFSSRGRACKAYSALRVDRIMSGLPLNADISSASGLSDHALTPHFRCPDHPVTGP